MHFILLATALIHDDIPRGLALHAGRKALALLAERNELLAETLGSLWIDYGSLNLLVLVMTCNDYSIMTYSDYGIQKG